MHIKPLLTEKDIWVRLAELGESIRSHYQGQDYVVLCALKGSVIFMADLVRKLDQNIEIDFIKVRSYGTSTSPEHKPIVEGLESIELKDRHVLLLDDILDTGNTLQTLSQLVQQKKPKSITSCVLLNKEARRQVDFTVTWVGFSIEDLFVVGYGLDYQGRFRNLPYIGIVEG